MSKPFDREKARQELCRLADGLDYYREWKLRWLRRERPDADQQDLEGEVVMPGAVFVEVFDATPGRKSKQILEDVQAIYAHTASDLSCLAASSQADRRDVRAFFAAFQRDRGVSFHAEAGHYRSKVVAAVERGRIRDDAEYELFLEVAVAETTGILNEAEFDQLKTMLRAYESMK